LLAPLSAYLAARVRVLSLAYYNAPERMPRHANFTSYDVKFRDQIRSCEDVLLLENRRVALLACDPGRETWNTVMVSRLLFRIVSPGLIHVRVSFLPAWASMPMLSSMPTITTSPTPSP
jgi:hypothetical protein